MKTPKENAQLRATIRLLNQQIRDLKAKNKKLRAALKKNKTLSFGAFAERFP